MTKTLKELQLELDKQKYYASINANFDQCGLLTYCKFCKYEEEYPCAKAFERENTQPSVKKTCVKKPAVSKKKVV